MGSLTPGEGEIWEPNPQPKRAIENCSQTVSLILLPAEYKRAVGWNCHSDFAFCQITLVLVFVRKTYIRHILFVFQRAQDSALFLNVTYPKSPFKRYFIMNFVYFVYDFWMVDLLTNYHLLLVVVLSFQRYFFKAYERVFFSVFLD